MKYSNGKIGGILFFIAAAQFILLGILIAEAPYPGYIISKSEISYFGGLSAMIYNTSIFLLGALIIVGAYLLQKAFKVRILTVLLTITALGFMGASIFTHNSYTIHFLAAVIAFVFGGLSAIYSYKLITLPFSLISILLGVMSLSAAVLYITQQYLGLNLDGMERMIIYPLLI